MSGMLSSFQNFKQSETTLEKTWKNLECKVFFFKFGNSSAEHREIFYQNISFIEKLISKKNCH